MPEGASLNDFIDYVRLSYDKVDDAFRSMKSPCYLAKVDIAASFRHISMDPSDWCLVAFKWKLNCTWIRI